MDIPAAYLGNEPYIFLSYSHADNAAAYEVISALNENGYRVWYDDGITPGAEWDVNIAEHIKDCSFFISLISKNYLNSSNCRDELNFVRDLNKPQLLIYLENVQLPDAMQMRLGRLQALFLFNYAGREDRFYEKLAITPELEKCRDARNNPLPQEPAPVAAPDQPVPVPQTPVSRTEPGPSPKSSKKMIVVAVAAILVIAVIGLALKGMGGSSSTKTPASSATAAVSSEEMSASSAEESTGSTADTESGSMADIQTLSGGKSIILGTHAGSYDKYDFKTMQTLDHNGETYEVAALPFYINAGYKELDDICLGFFDDHEYKYYFYGKYTLENGVLHIKPGGTAPEIEGDVAPFGDELEYKVGLDSYKLKLETANGEDTVLPDILPTDRRMIIKGALSEGSEAFEGIQSLSLDMDTETEKVNSCELIFTDGKKAGGFEGSFFSVSNFDIRYTTLTYTKNGKEMTDKYSDTVFITLVNNYPYGFTIVDDGKLYYYQN